MPQQFDRILAIKNPVSSHVERADRVIDRLFDSRWGSRLEVLETQDPRLTDNTALISDSLSESTLVLGIGGDGLMNDVGNGIIRAQDEERVGPDTVGLIALPTGNGNDFSMSVHGRRVLRHRPLDRLLEQGETVRLDSLRMEINNPGQELDLTRHAIGYVGVGFTGLAAVGINLPEFRERRANIPPCLALGRRVLDTAQVLKALRQREPFVYKNGSAQAIEAQEILLSLVPRVAAGVLRIDTQPSDGKVIGLELGHKNFMGQALATILRGHAMAKLGLGRFSGVKGREMDGEHHISLHSDTVIQYDGEPFTIPDGTSIAITHRPDTLPVIV